MVSWLLPHTEILGLGCLLKWCMCSCCPTGVRGSAINLAVSRISIENTHYHVPLRDFQTRLCTVPSIFILGLTLQHYSVSILNWWTVPARCHPNVSRLEGGFDDNPKEKRLSRKLVRSVKRWAASVMTARLPAMCPPGGCRIEYGVRAPECN